MIHHKPVFILMTILGLALAPVLVAPARGETFGDVVVSVEPPPAAQTIHGYAPYRVQVVNRSPDKPHAVTLTMPARSYSGGARIRSLRRSIAVQAGGTATTFLFQPAVEISGSDVSVVVDDGAEKGDMALGFGNHKQPQSAYGGYYGYSGSSEPAQILVSRGFGGQFGEIMSRLSLAAGTVPPGASAPPPPSTPGGPALAINVIHAESDVSQWPSQWLAFGAYDMIVLADSDMETMDAGVRTALWQYAQVGGVLVVAGQWHPPDNWGASPMPTRSNSELTYFGLGFGQCLVISAAPPKWTPANARAMATTAVEVAAPHRNVLTPVNANTVMPVVDKIAVPARGLLAIVIVFALFIGPVNLFVLSRKKRKIHLLWTVPVLSFLAAGTVVAYATVAEGFRGTVRTQGLTILDERSGQAATLGWTAFYCPLTPGGGLHFGYDTELTPQIAQEGYRNDSNQSLAVDWTSDQHLTSGWVASRMPLHLAVRKCEPRRERLLFQKMTDGTSKVVNGLGVPIIELRLMDAQGRTFHASSISPGQEMTLQAGAGTPNPPTGTGGTPIIEAGVAPPAGAASFQSFYLRGQWQDLSAAGALPLAPGTYVALLDGSPFIENGLPGVKTQHTTHVVYGYLRDPSGAVNPAADGTGRRAASGTESNPGALP